MKRDLNTFIQLFWTFLKMGPVTFGGGYAMIPLIEKEIVDKKEWLTREDIADVFAVAEMIPGAIAINVSTFVGFRIAGTRGALAALLGIFLPTFLIVILLSMLFLTIQDHPKIAAAFQAIRASVVALIVYAAYVLGKAAIVDKTTLMIAIGSMSLLLLLNLHPILLILLGIGFSALIIKLKKRLGYAVAALKEKESQDPRQELDFFKGEGI